MLIVVFWLLVVNALATDAPTEESISKMKVKELKKFLSDRGVECDNCVEKGDWVKKAKASLSVPILPEKIKPQVSTEPIDKQWGKIAADTCAKLTDKADFCKQLKGIVEGAMYQYARKYKRDLSVEPQHLTTVSMSFPYYDVGVLNIKETVEFMLKENTKSGDKVRPIFEEKVKPWLRDVGLENSNPMYEKLGPGATKKKGRSEL
eukprot:TRINITY_DN7046_c0_g1_i1.p1 TRINITY_DN7046_c0_g1~~TRINITY_DN7046_c0_g1_i1.p1  ORF type:complete len:205 (+),score=51.96 TRINITY_DN7046_c0_g1_i1:39-653(+)